MDYLAWALWQFLYVLFWTWPLYYISWLAVIVLLFSARTEYVRTGGGLKGFVYAAWYAIKNLPRTMNAIARWIVKQIILLAEVVTKTDIESQLPNFVRRWLGRQAIETREVVREKIVYRERSVRRPLWKRTLRLFYTLTVGTIFGVGLTRAYDYGYLRPWIYAAVSWLSTSVSWLFNQF